MVGAWLPLPPGNVKSVQDALLSHQTGGGGLQPAPSLAGRPPTTEVLYCSRALSGDSAVSSSPAVVPKFVVLASGRGEVSRCLEN